MTLGKCIFGNNQYMQYISSKSKIHFILGKIKKRSDGRWTWIRLVSEHNTRWNIKTGYIQGTSLTELAAQMKILEGWD